MLRRITAERNTPELNKLIKKMFLLFIILLIPVVIANEDVPTIIKPIDSAAGGGSGGDFIYSDWHNQDTNDSDNVSFQRIYSFEADDTYIELLGGSYVFVVSDYNIANFSSDNGLEMGEDITFNANNSYDIGRQDTILHALYVNYINGSQSQALRIVGGEGGTELEGNTLISGNVNISPNYGGSANMTIYGKNPAIYFQNNNSPTYGVKNNLILSEPSALGLYAFKSPAETGGDGMYLNMNVDGNISLWGLQSKPVTLYAGNGGNIGKQLSAWDVSWIDEMHTEDLYIGKDFVTGSLRANVTQLLIAYNFSQNHLHGSLPNQSVNTTDNVTFHNGTFEHIRIGGTPVANGNFMNVQGYITSGFGISVEIQTNASVTAPFYFVVNDDSTSGGTVLVSEGAGKFTEDITGTGTIYGDRRNLGATTAVSSTQGSRTIITKESLHNPPSLNGGDVVSTGFRHNPGVVVGFSGDSEYTSKGIDVLESAANIKAGNGDWERYGVYVADYTNESVFNKSYSYYAEGGEARINDIISTNSSVLRKGFLYLFDTNGGTTIANSASNVTFDQVPRRDTEYTYTADGDYITITITGTYKISFDGTATVSDTTRSHVDWYMEKDTGGGFAEVSGTRIGTYHRDLNDGKGTGSFTIIEDLNAGDDIKITAISDRATEVTTVADGVRLTMERIG